MSCVSSRACTAVGRAGDPYVTLAERWSGIRWSIQHTINPVPTIIHLPTGGDRARRGGFSRELLLHLNVVLHRSRFHRPCTIREVTRRTLEWNELEGPTHPKSTNRRLRRVHGRRDPLQHLMQIPDLLHYRRLRSANRRHLRTACRALLQNPPFGAMTAAMCSSPIARGHGWARAYATAVVPASGIRRRSKAAGAQGRRATPDGCGPSRRTQ